MEAREGSAPGKIILSGEYAVVFSYPGIAVPYPIMTTATFTPDAAKKDVIIETDTTLMHPEWGKYLRKVVDLCREHGDVCGSLSIKTDLPVGKGMGSSTSVVIAIARAILATDIDKETVRSMENTMNPGNSGIDFEVIWENAPVYFEENDRRKIALPKITIKECILIDTGVPDQTTPELVAAIRARHEAENLDAIFQDIAQCTKDIVQGASLKDVLPKHHRAQQALGVVPDHVARFIDIIESKNGAGKIIGAGAKSGGGGIVLACGITKETIESLLPDTYSIVSL